MSELLIKESRPFPQIGYGFLQLVFNNSGKAIDYVFLNVSAGFQKMIGLHRDNILGEKASQVFLGKKRKFNWIESFQGALITQRIHEISRYVEVLERDCNIIIVPSAGACFSLIIQDAKSDRKENTYQNTAINMLLKDLRAQCVETIEHARRVEAYCNLLGRSFQLTSEKMEELSLLAILHDIGKIGVNPAILKTCVIDE